MTSAADGLMAETLAGDPPSPECAPLILIVDDTPVNLELVSRILQAEGFRTVRARNGREALERSRPAGIDLILLDVMMPDLSGIEVCAQLKSDPVTADIPIIFLSALDDVNSRVAGLKAGGVDYISKPFHSEEVLARVRIHLRIRQSLALMAREQMTRLEALRQAQQSMLVRPEDLPEAAFAVSYRPLEAVGGDVYDVLSLGEDVFAYFVADISGHGIGPGFLTAAVRALLRQYSSPLYSPEDTMRGINAVMHSTLHDEQYLTACYARLYKRRHTLSVVSAGHPPLIHVSAAGQAGTVAVESDPLGIFGAVVLQKQDIRMQPGDRFFLYTDGLIERRNLPAGGRAAGVELLRQACERCHGMPLAEAVSTVSERIRPAAEPSGDDLLLLGVEIRK